LLRDGAVSVNVQVVVLLRVIKFQDDQVQGNVVTVVVLHAVNSVDLHIFILKSLNVLFQLIVHTLAPLVLL
jgi:hypothetical protein